MATVGWIVVVAVGFVVAYMVFVGLLQYVLMAHVVRRFKLSPTQVHAWRRMTHDLEQKLCQAVQPMSEAHLAVVCKALGDDDCGRLLIGQLSIADALRLGLERAKAQRLLESRAEPKENSNPAREVTHHQARQANDAKSRMNNTVWLFMESSLLMVRMGNLADTDEKKALVHAFAFGVFDGVSQCLGMDQMDTLAAICAFYMSYFKMSAEEAGLASRRCMDLHEGSKTGLYMQAGCQAVQNWMRGAKTKEVVGTMDLWKLLQSEQLGA